MKRVGNPAVKRVGNPAVTRPGNPALTRAAGGPISSALPMVPAHLALVLLAALALGCGASVEDICQSFVDECVAGDVQDLCVDDGQLLEARAEQKDCLELFDDYLSCVDDAGCGFASACAGARETLEGCVGAFPDDP